MRILLVAPSLEYPVVTPGWDLRPGWLGIPQMSLLILQALSGDEHEVVIAEEEREPVPLTEPWDLVGITVMTATAPRAYKLSEWFRKRGAKVILGGIHASVRPEEASRYADAVLIGEAEPLWEKILADAAGDRLQPIYHNVKQETLQLPLVRYRNGKKSRFPALAPVVASRGCPNQCDFCSIPRIYGHKVRKVPVDQVLEQVKRARGDYVAFLDDNLTASRGYALELFEALRNLKIKFITQVPLKFILDDELFHLGVAAGLKGVLVGFESIEEASLKRYKKAVALDEAARAIKKCRTAGVFLHGSFIFGMDEHDKTVFPHTLNFIMENKIPSISAYILTPYPTTPIFDRFLQEGRLLHQQWAFYDHITPVFLPARMTMQELAEGYMKFRKSVFSLMGIAHRFPAGISVNPYAYIHLNAAFRRTTFELKKHYQNYFKWLEGPRHSSLSELKA
jgi:radical SAM superfamily enzyme YgiQ (UPF0313 family)